MANNNTKKPINYYETIMLWSWIVCGITLFIGIFARRLFLLEIVVPTLAGIGFITLGINLWKIAVSKRSAPKKKK